MPHSPRARRGTPLFRNALLASAAVALLAVSTACADDAGTSSPAAGTASASTTTYPGVESLADLYAGNSVAPPTTGGPTPAKGKSLYIIVCGYAAASCAAEGNATEAAAKALGWTTTKVDGQLNVGNAYVSLFTQAIAAKPDAIVAIGPDCATVSTSLQQAKDAGIPTILSEGVDCDDPKNQTPSAPLYTRQLEFLPNALTYGPFSELQNHGIGDYIINKTNANAQLIEMYYRYQVLGEYEHAGLDDALANCPNCKVLTTLEFNNNDLAGPALSQKIAAALSSTPNANSLFYNYSSAAQLGNLASNVRTAGRQDDMVVAGGEGAAANLDVIRQGSSGLSAEAAYSQEWAGWGIVNTAVRLFADLPAVPEGIGFSMVDKDHGLPAAGQDWNPPGIDFKANYLKLWGVSQ